MSGEESPEQVRRDFGDAVNMSPSELEDWLATDESKSVGAGEGESVGHASGRRIVTIKRKRNDELTDDDYAHMRKVVGFVNRHLAQGGPSEGKETSAWRYSLMNWGRDPLR